MQAFMVKSRDGKWLKTGRTHWTEDQSRAKLFNKIGVARGRLTWWARNYPEYGVPSLVVFDLVEQPAVDETERVKAAGEKKEKAKAARKIAQAKRQLKQAEESVSAAQKVAQALHERFMTGGNYAR